MGFLRCNVVYPAAILLCSLTISTKGLVSTDFALFDRFRAACPVDAACLQAFDPSLQHQDEHIWVAVYRSCNNAPSVLVRDEFLHAMRSATNAVNPAAFSLETSSSFETTPFSNQLNVQQTQQTAPVAVARMRPSEDYPGSWVLDTMRCALKKESQDASCDGGSEYLEAISTAIDALLEYHLSCASANNGDDDKRRKHFSIRTKATLVSSKLLEDRGFVEVDRLERDMATHISCLDACLERYAERSITTDAKSQGARQRALKIVSLLGRLEPSEAQHHHDENIDDKDDDLWASLRRINS
jgi:hypothetical protein